jgi:hypothetical protein
MRERHVTYNLILGENGLLIVAALSEHWLAVVQWVPLTVRKSQGAEQLRDRVGYDTSTHAIDVD